MVRLYDEHMKRLAFSCKDEQPLTERQGCGVWFQCGWGPFYFVYMTLLSCYVTFDMFVANQERISQLFYFVHIIINCIVTWLNYLKEDT